MRRTEQNIFGIIFVQPGSMLVGSLLNSTERIFIFILELFGLESFNDFLSSVPVMDIEIDDSNFPNKLGESALTIFYFGTYF